MLRSSIGSVMQRIWDISQSHNNKQMHLVRSLKFFISYST